MNSLDKYSEEEWNDYLNKNQRKGRMADLWEMENEGRVEDPKQENSYKWVNNHTNEDILPYKISKELLKNDATKRKETPIFSGVLMYFPDAIKAVARCSFVGNDQHHPDKPLHWDRAKSGDEKDALARHLMDAGKLDTDGIRHSAKVAWRALANLQKEIEQESRVNLNNI